MTRWTKLILGAALAFGGSLDSAPARKPGPAFGQLPLSFERNIGQVDSRVEYLARGKGYTLFLTKGAEAVLALAGHSLDIRDRRADEDGAALDAASEAVNGAVLKLRFVGTDPRAVGEAESQLPGVVNYLVGSDRSAWRTGIPTYGKVRYREVYPGIDIVFVATRGSSSTT